MFPLSEYSDSLDPKDQSLINVWEILYGKKESDKQDKDSNTEVERNGRREME